MSNMTLPSIRSTSPCAARSSRGFTLVEVLVSGVFGALLLTSVAYATFEFTLGISHLEEKAGIPNNEDTALRILTRDIREAWWANVLADDHLQLADENGDLTEYYAEEGNLVIRRPNGDTGAIYEGLASLTFVPTFTDRTREGDPVDLDGIWYTRNTPASPAMAFTPPVASKVAMGFVVPVHDVQVPGQGDNNEQLNLAQPDVLSLPLAFIPGTNPETVIVTLYESHGPGKAAPYGTAIGSQTLAGAGLPPAVWDEDEAAWELPASSVALGLASINENLVPGRGYTLVLEATGDAQLLFDSRLQMAADDVHEIAMDTGTGTFVVQDRGIPFSLSGDFQLTSTTGENVVSRVTVTLKPSDRPVVDRSAALLSQAIADDSWYGVVPGQAAP